MDTPRDPWLQEQIERHCAGNAASAAFYQQAIHLVSAQQQLAASAASRHQRLRSLGRLLRAAFGRLHRRGRRASMKSPNVLEGSVTPVSTENDESTVTVIVVGLQHHQKGE